LKNIGKTVPQETAKPKEEDIPDQNIVINEETFQALWVEYTQLLKQQGNNNFYTVFSNTSPMKVEEGWLYISYSNPLQESILLEAKWDLQEFFAKKLDGQRIGIKTVLIEQAVDPNKKVLYTDEDKLRYLSEKHPLVDELKKRMGLDPNI
jgi:DNA polymerase III subunit gamma/tau